MLSISPLPRDAGGLAGRVHGASDERFPTVWFIPRTMSRSREAGQPVCARKRWRSPARHGRAYDGDSGTRGHVG
jgi:hypothetical protein